MAGIGGASSDRRTTSESMHSRRCSTIRLRSRVISFTSLFVFAAALAAPSDPPPLKSDDVAERAGPTDPVRFTANASHYYFGDINSTAYPALLFLPPRIPVLYASALLRSPLDNGVEPPSELGAYVNDLFYPQLAAQLAADSLSHRLRVHLDTYRNDRQSLQELLQARDHGATAANVGALDDQIAKLETSAEQLRHELGSVKPGRPAMRPPATAAPAERAQYMRGIAFHLDGISGKQRRLLFTAADSLETATAGASTPARLFVAPEGGRFVLPADAPPALVQSLSVYAQEQGRILDELLLGITVTNDLDTRQATIRLAALADAQAPAFTLLEARADTIRAGIRTLLDHDQRSDPTPPPELAQRIAAYQDHKQELFRELYASLPQTTSPPAVERSGSVAVPVSTFTPAQQEKLMALKKEHAALRAALVEQRQKLGSSTDRKSIDDLLEEFTRARRTEELHQKYRLYREALLRPDLSPAERRLLLDCALQALHLPLPTGEPVRQP
jgi:hypothetical protein